MNLFRFHSPEMMTILKYFFIQFFTSYSLIFYSSILYFITESIFGTSLCMYFLLIIGYAAYLESFIDFEL